MSCHHLSLFIALSTALAGCRAEYEVHEDDGGIDDLSEKGSYDDTGSWGADADSEPETDYGS